MQTLTNLWNLLDGKKTVIAAAIFTLTFFLTQFEKGTGLSRPTIVKTLKNLISMNMVVKVCLPDEGIEYTFEKDHEKWVVNTAKLVKHNAFPSKHGLTETSKHGLTHKRNKETNTKEITSNMSKLKFGKTSSSAIGTGWLNWIRYYPIRLTNSQIKYLTR